MGKRKIIISLIIALLIILLATKSYGLSGIWEKGLSWITPDGTETGFDDSNAKSVISEIAGILFGIGIFVFVIGGVVFGIRYMIVGGIEERAEIKKEILPYFIGGVIIIGALGIWKFFIDVAEGLY